MGKVVTVFIMLCTGYVYSQQIRSVENNVERQMSRCISLSETSSSKSQKQVCTQYETCQLLPYTTSEPVPVVCSCSLRYSMHHPDYGSRSQFPSWSSEGLHLDYNKAKEKAREDCNFDLSQKNPVHWAAIINCNIRYRYQCDDGSIIW